MAVVGIAHHHYFSRSLAQDRVVVGLPMCRITIHRCWADQSLNDEQRHLFFCHRFNLTSSQLWAAKQTAEVHARCQWHLFVSAKRVVQSLLKQHHVPWATNVVVEPAMTGLGRAIIKRENKLTTVVWWLVVNHEVERSIMVFYDGDVCYYQALPALNPGTIRQQLLIVASIFSSQAMSGVVVGMDEQSAMALRAFSVAPIAQHSLDDIFQQMAEGHAYWGDDD